MRRGETESNYYGVWRINLIQLTVSGKSRDDDPDPFEYFKQPWAWIALIAIYAAGFMLGQSYMAQALG